jgi:tryptophan 2,3-dioxygenase
LRPVRAQRKRCLEVASAEMAGTDYTKYLRIDELLRLQDPLTDGADDELLFIVVHQSYELWFKVVLQELSAARDRLLGGEPWLAAPRLRRATAVEELLLQHLGVLETMSPDGFLRFRDPLAPASGFQSTQYREIEAISGRPAAESPLLSDEQRSALARRALEPTLWDALRATVSAHCDVGGAGGDLLSDEEMLSVLAGVYRDHAEPVRASIHDVCERFVDHDEALARWRHHHALMAAREIGRRQGTGGSLGVAYLESRLDERFFPVLWKLRSVL